MDGTDRQARGATPLFLLSFRQRDELAAAAAKGGWHVVAARRAEGAGRRLLASGAPVALVDARGAVEEGIAATRELAQAGEARGIAILVLLSRDHGGRIGDFFDAGATHFLTSPMRGPEVVQAIRFAARYAERMGGDAPSAVPPGVDTLGWRYDPELRSLQVTPALARLAGLPEQTNARQLLRRLGPADRPTALAALRRLREGAASTAFAHELPEVGRVVEHLQRTAGNGRIHALVEPLGSVPDSGAALRDVFPNVRDEPGARRWLDRRLGEGASLGIALAAVEGLDVVNLRLGRTAGDAALRTIHRRIDQIVRDVAGREALVARIGGSEFLIASDGDPARLELACGQVENALGRPSTVIEAAVPVQVRLALIWSVAGETARELLSRAGAALIEARGEASGPGKAMLDQPLDQLAADLRSAIESDAIDIRFQPQVSVTSGAIVGAEALARWRHPALGELGAETLFAAAERAGLGIAVSDHVQRRALTLAARWPAALGELRLSMNITAEDVARPGFVDILLDRIDASGFPRARLTIEVTEGGLIDDLGEAARLLAELRSGGCRVAIDDFGTGYSSLAYLKALPLDYLKIDKRLTQDIDGSPRDRVVVRGVIDMARSLGLAVVAEGVETETQLELLATEGCQYYQGFLCAEPIDAAALAALVEKR